MNDYLPNIFFVTFCLVMTFVMLNMFISIVNDAFTMCQLDLNFTHNKYDLIEFLTERLANFLPSWSQTIHKSSIKRNVRRSHRWTEKRRAVVNKTVMTSHHSRRRSRRRASLLRVSDVSLLVGGATCYSRLAECVSDVEGCVDRFTQDELLEDEMIKYLWEKVRWKRTPHYS